MFEPTTTNHFQTSNGRFRRLVQSGNDPNEHAPHHQTVDCVDQVKRGSYVLMLCVQGALSGLCIHTLYRIFSGLSNTEEESRRFYFVSTSIVTTGSLCIVGEGEVLRPKQVDIALIRAVVYVVGLVMGLVSSLLPNPSDGIEIAKSVCGILGWLCTSFQIYRMARYSKVLSRSKDSNESV